MINNNSKNKKIILSIIIPAYNAEPYINELLDKLNSQIRDDVEVIIIDDGSIKPFRTAYKFAKVFRKENGGASSARNLGIDKAKGQYIAFIDADDLVSFNYIESIVNKIEKEKFDFCYLSWRTMGGGWHCDVKLNSIEDKFPPFNLCVWNRVYKRSVIGKTRFNELKQVAEDAEFIRAIKEEGKKKAFISDYMVFYRSVEHNSLTQRLSRGEVYCRRVVYHFSHVSNDMQYLIDEFKELNKDTEVILMTQKNDIQELNNYAMIINPIQIRGTELRGEPTPLFSKIEVPIKTQVVLYIGQAQKIGGIETFIYNFCCNLSKYYDIAVAYSTYMDFLQIRRLKKLVPVVKLEKNKRIICDIVINMRISDEIPKEISYKKKIQMCHTCKLHPLYEIPKNNDLKVIVSKTAAQSFNEKNAEIINNLILPPDKRKALRLISATRLSTWEKGSERMAIFAKKLKEASIQFTWLIFSDVKPKEMIKGMVWLEPELDIIPFIKSSDYLVQLSQSESFCYSIIEALTNKIPCISTDLEVLKEINFKDGIDGYVIPQDLNFDPKRFLCIPEPDYFYDNEEKIEHWRKILGDKKPLHNYIPGNDLIRVEALLEYKDILFNKMINKGQQFEVKEERANDLVNKKLVKIIED